MTDNDANQPCNIKVYEITEADLPLCCPLPSMRIWDAHPRVYLPIEKTGKEICPYCGAQFFLKKTHSSNSV